MSDIGMTFQQLKERLGTNITQEELVKTADTLEVAVPLRERVFFKNHKPKSAKEEVGFVVIPNPTAASSRSLWVRKTEFPALLASLNEFAKDKGLV